MEDSGKAPTDHERYEAEIQEAQEEIASIQLELDAVLDEEARDIVYKVDKITLKLERDPPAQEKQKLREELEILLTDPHYAKYSAIVTRIMDAEVRHWVYTSHLGPVNAPPAGPLQEISAPETGALAGDGKAQSKSLSSLLFFTFT